MTNCPRFSRVALSGPSPRFAVKRTLRLAFAVRPLVAAIAGQLLLAQGAMAAPAGGTVVGGSGVIEQSGVDTTITQNTNQLAIDWASFNVAANERVAFVQPSESSIALNRILDASGSQILGRIEANGQIILMNPNGIFFGADATVNVGGLIATGLAIDTSDFMNGDLLLQAVDGTAGTVINRGLINAATGGNVALIGKQVTNSGLISANLGHVALASGRQAVVTFDDQGLLGVRVDEASLQAELGMGPGVNNSGTITAAGGKILLTGSVSENLFARAVNAGGLGGDTQAAIHEDGSFTLGASVDVLNTGTLSTTTDTGVAGDVVMVGRNVNQRGIIAADHSAGGEAGGIHLEANNAVRLTHGATLSAQGAADTGDLVLKADQVIGNSGTSIRTTGDTALTAHLQLKTPTLATQNLTIKSVGTVRQTGALTVAGTTHLVLTAEADLRLNDRANDFNRVTMDTGHTSYVSLQDANDLELGTLDLLDSTVKLDAQGTIRQAETSAALLDGSDLHLSAAQIELGALSEGSGISLYNGWLNLQFSEAIQAMGSVHTPGDFNYSLITAKGFNGVDLLMARSQGEFELAATLAEFSGMTIGGLTADTAALTTLGEIQQTGAIRLSGAFNLNMGAGGSAYLNHENNDFRSVNFDLGHTSVVELTDANDLLIGNLNVTDSSVTLTSLGANAMISQMAMTSIDLYDSTLAVSAARLYLGDKATTQLRLHNFSDLRAYYTRGARIFGTSSSPAELPEFVPFLTYGDSDATRLDAQGHGSFALNVSTNDLRFNIHQLQATNAQLSSISQVRQTGAIHLDGEFFLRTPVGGQVVLDNPENDFNLITIESGHATGISLTDANDLLLGNWDMTDTSVTLRSVGEQATVKQAENTAISGGDSDLTIHAANIELGAQGTASIAFGNIGMLRSYFTESLAINGRIRLGGTSSYFLAEGTDGANQLTIGEFADIDITSIFEDYLIDLKAGNDIIEIHRDFAYGFFTGADRDQIYLVDNEVNYTVADFDPAQDEILLLP